MLLPFIYFSLYGVLVFYQYRKKVLQNNFNALMFQTSDKNILILDVLKVIALSFVLLGHYWLIYGIANPSFFQQISTSPIIIILFNAVYAVDAFLWISGYLYGLKIKQLKINTAFQLIVHRILRLYPAFIFILMPYIWISNDNTCNKVFWDLFFLNSNLSNNFGCFEWIWYLEVEVQIFIFITLLFSLFSKQYYTKIIILLLILNISYTILECLILNYQIYYYALTDGQYYYNFYQKPWFRITPFLIGYLTSCYKQNTYMVQNMLLGVSLLGYSLFGWIPFIYEKELFGNLFNNINSALSRLVFSLSLTFIFLSMQKPNRLYQSLPQGNIQIHIVQQYLQLITKISLNIYLIHYFCYQQLLYYFSSFNMIFQFFGQTVMIIFLSVMLHITIEVPSSNIWRQFFIQIQKDK